MAANVVRSDDFSWKEIHGTGNAQQYLGHTYNSTTHNHAGPTPPINVTVKPPDDPIHGDFVRACGQGQGPQRLNFLLSRGADIEYRDEQQKTPLHHAASNGSLSTLRYLVGTGADIYAGAPRIGTPLHSAALSGSTGAVKYLVDAGADVNAHDEIIGTPLHCAAFGGSADTVGCLLDSGAQKDTFSRWVGTPLSLAAAKAHTDVVEILLDHGVDVNEPCGYFGSAAHMACAVGNIQLLKRLQLAGACFDQLKDTCRDVYCDVLESMSPSFPNSLGSRTLEGRDVIWGCAVTLAIIHGNLEAARFCIGMDPKGNTYSSYWETWYTDSKWRCPSRHLCSMIDLAIASLDLDILQLLMESGVFHDRDEMRGWIYRLGSDSRVNSSNGKNASACISLLIRHGLQTNSLDTGGDTGGNTLLMVVMRRVADEANYEIAKALLQHGVQVNAVNHKGQTALMIAAGTKNKSRVQCIQLLCDHGAAVDLKDEDGRNALRYAQKWGGSEGFKDVKRILLSFGRSGTKACLSSST